MWSALVLNYQKHLKQCILNINEDSALFNNEALNRKLPLEGRSLILEELSKSGNAATTDKKKIIWEVYWHTLEEWGNMIYNWVIENGMTNTVCTLFELVSGDVSSNKEFYGLEQGILLKALRTLENKNKCEIIMYDDNEGVKFF